MRPLSLFFALPVLLTLARCAAVPMPVTAIPKKEKSIEGSVYLGNNGLGINVVYATKRMFVLNAAAQASNILTNSRAYDIGLGKAWDRSKLRYMGMATFGYGKYAAEPFTLGATGQVYMVNSDAFRVGFYLNMMNRRRWGMVNRISCFWGQSQSHRVSQSSDEKHKYRAISYEPTVYYLFGKKANCILGFGISLTANSSSYTPSTSSSPKDLNPSPVFAIVGYRFAQSDPR